MFNRYAPVAREDNSFPNRETMVGSELLIDLEPQAYNFDSSSLTLTQHLNCQRKSCEAPLQSEAFQDLLELQDRASISHTLSNPKQGRGHEPQTTTPTCFTLRPSLGTTPNSDRADLKRAKTTKSTTKFRVDISAMPYIPPHLRQKIANKGEYVPPHERQKAAEKGKYVPLHERQKVANTGKLVPGQYVPPHMRNQALHAEATSTAATGPTQVIQDDPQTITLFNINRTKSAPSQIEADPETQKSSLYSTNRSTDPAGTSSCKSSMWEIRTPDCNSSTQANHVRVDFTITQHDTNAGHSNSAAFQHVSNIPTGSPPGMTIGTTIAQSTRSSSPHAANAVASNRDDSQVPSNNRNANGTHIHSHLRSAQATVQNKTKHVDDEPKPMVKASRWLTKEEKKAMKARPVSNDEHGGWGEEDVLDSNNIKNLVDWEGNWLPAPVEWAGRQGYKRDKFYESTADWIENVSTWTLKKLDPNAPAIIPISILDVNTDVYRRTDRNVEHAPRDWIPVQVEGQPLQAFWKSLRQSSLEPVDEEDVQSRPYWQMYLSNDSEFQAPLEVPSADLDPADEIEEGGMYTKGKTMTAADAIERRTWKAEMAEKKKKQLAKAERRARKEMKRNEIVAPPNPFRPKVNIYLRPVTVLDIQQMALIYSHYVEETCYVSEMTPPDMTKMTDRINHIQVKSNLPIVVAIEKPARKSGANRNEPTLMSTHEKVVGFAYADESEGKVTMNSFVVELETFVHPDYLNKGVGKSLVDRMMFLLDPRYSSREAVEWRAPRDIIHLHVAGGMRIVGTVRTIVHYPAEDKIRLIWIERWLKQFGFEKRANLDGAIKLGQFVNTAIFQAKTGSDINPRNVVIGTAY